MRRAIDTPCPPSSLGDVREHARTVGDLDVDVERGAQISRRQRRRAFASDGVVLQEAGAGRADDADHVGDHRRCRLDAACAGTVERDLPDRVALQHHGVERALDARKRMATVDECRMHANVDRAVLECRCTDEADDHVELLGAASTCCRLDPARCPSGSPPRAPTREPKATVARIAIFAAASAPEMSSVGSASA